MNLSTNDELSRRVLKFGVKFVNILKMNNLHRCIGVGIVLTVLVAVAVGDDDAAAFVAFDCEVSLLSHRAA